MHALALVEEPLALPDPEPVLLIDDRQGQAGEPHFVLEEGVGAHRHGRLSRRQALQLLPARGATIPPGQQDHADPGGLKR